MRETRSHHTPEQRTRLPTPKRQFYAKQLESSDPLHDAFLSGSYEHEDGSTSKYSVIGFIGKGGMGGVYLAIENKTDEPVAVKIILENLLEKNDGNGHLDRFLREAKNAARIEHPNVVRTTDVGTFKDKVFYVMEYLEGQDLLKKLKSEHKLGWDALRPIMLSVCEAVQAAHDANVIHRDLKPDNIFLAQIEGNTVVKVLDFGLAKSTQGEDDGLTKTDSVLGTMSYIAPEQLLKAIGQGDYDHRVDIYAMGVIMYRILSGKFPYEDGKQIETILKRTRAPPPRPSEHDSSIPADVEAVIMKAMEINPSNRYQTASALKAALERCNYNKTTTDSKDVFIREAMKPVSAAKARVGVPALALLDEAEGKSDRTPSLEEQKAYSKKPWGKLMAWTAILGSLAFAGYHFRDNIRSTYEDVRQRLEGGQQAESPAPATSQPGNVFMADIKSEPSGAAVFEVVGGRSTPLGTTPLVTPLSSERHTLLLTKGRSTRRVVVSPTSPAVSVNFARRPVKSQPRIGDGGTREEEPVEIQEVEIEGSETQ